MSQPITVPAGKPIRLAEFDPNCSDGADDKDNAERETAANIQELGDLAYRLYAEDRRAVLVVLQGMDTAGKDGAIRKVMRGVSPQSCRVTPFRSPSAEELSHDFLWRIHRAVPKSGAIGIFNRSHYEDVLVVRVKNLVPESEWRTRYDRINEFEQLLADGGTTVVKCFLHISKEEQRKRLQARLDNPKKRWKFDPSDLADRRLWDDFQAAYEEALSRCNTPHAPWHIIPADKKWRRNLVLSRVLRRTLESMAPEYPPAHPELDGLHVE